MCIVVTILAGSANQAVLAQQTSDRAALESALEKVFEGEDYQRELPLKPEEGQGGSEREKPPEPPAPRSDRNFDLEQLGFIGKAVLLVFAVVLALLLIRAVIAYLQDLKRRARMKKAGDAEEAGGEAAMAEISSEVEHETLGHADQLAGQGRYAEAIRVLLFCCVEHIRESYYAGLSPALTNREISVSEWLPRGARESLGHIVDTEELTQFGGRDAAADDFGACREAFVRFVSFGRKGVVEGRR